MMINRLKLALIAFQSKQDEHNGRRALILFYFQIVLSVILVALGIMLLIVQNPNEYLYLSIVVLILALQLFAIKLNLSNQYKLSASLTMFAAIVGPWISIAFDTSIIMGDIIPLVYVILIIHLSSMFFSLKTTIVLAIIQFVLILVLSLSSPAILEQNIASLFSFLIIASVLVGLGSYLNKKQIEQIEEQNLKYLEKEKELQQLINHDSMTGLYNRTYINRIIESHKFTEPFTVFILDIDGLKESNDKHGHLEGDQLIISASKVIEKCFGKEDIVARIGGDEFMVILLNSNKEMVEKIKVEIDNNVLAYNTKCAKNHLLLNLSYGYASSTQDNSDIESLMKIADDQMYSHKNSK